MLWVRERYASASSARSSGRLNKNQGKCFERIHRPVILWHGQAQFRFVHAL